MTKDSNLTDLALAMQVVAVLHEAGVQCVIAGGSARDTLLGRVPKDYDIIILGGRDYSEEVMDALVACDMAFSTYGVHGNEYTQSNPQQSHLLWVMKTCNDGVAIDILQQRRSPMTPEQAVEGFDVTLNMAWFDINGAVFAHAAFPKPGELVRVLRDCDVPYNRIPYLAGKYPEYLWPTIPAPLGPFPPLQGH